MQDHCNPIVVNVNQRGEKDETGDVEGHVQVFDRPERYFPRLGF
jgi:hypothetical protein